MAEWLGALGGIAGAIGGFLNNNNSIDAQMQMLMMQQKFNAEQAKINRDWTEQMRKTSYQTAMEDMKKGGLNPILAGSLGGAPTPGVAAASMGVGSVPTQQNWMATGVASAAELMKAVTQAQLTAAEVEKTKAETGLIEEQTPTQSVTRQSLLAQIEQAKGNTRTEEERRELVRLEQRLMSLQGNQASAAAGASAAAAGLSQSATDKNRAELAILGRDGAYPGTNQGWSVGPGGVRVPPGAQVGGTISNAWDALSGAVSRAGAWSGKALRDAVGLTPSNPALDRLSEQAEKVVNGVGRQLQETQGRNPLGGPNPVRPRIIIRRDGPGSQYFPPMD